MEEKLLEQISQDLKIGLNQVTNTMELLEQGSTVPFIARYRKERTHGLDEEQIRLIQEQYAYQENLEKRKEEVLHRIETLGHLTEDLKLQIMHCTKLVEVEEIYRPYKQKKKTRASIAKEKGLEPLANTIVSCPRYFDAKEIQKYLNDQVKTIDEALQGAQDILAQRVSENEKVRNKVFDSMLNHGFIKTQEKKEHNDQQKVYRMYYDYSEKVTTLASHRIMAIDRGEKEKVLSVHIESNEDYLMNWTKRNLIRYPNSPSANYYALAIEDGLKRLVIPSVERSIRCQLSEKAQQQSMDIFSMNLEKLLLQAPMKNKIIMGFDPAFRTGCKLAIINEQGRNLHVDVIYPHPPKPKKLEAEKTLVSLCQQYHVNIIAIGNGTASRESEAFVAQTIQKYGLDVAYTIVSEAGASVYSASKFAIEEFPDLHVEQRSAISIARRLLDPLSELIKIDPQSIGVGQYQHDLPQKQLKERLDFVVDKSVNLVGVNVNTASPTLLKHISGLNATTAQNIVDYRQENGDITSRSQIKKVKKLGPKAFEQCAGFLRVENGKEPLDRTGIHPESYGIAKAILAHLDIQSSDLGSQNVQAKVKQVDAQKLAKELGSDAYTVADILTAFAQPLRDYRDQKEGPLLRKDVLEMEDLHIGQELEGTVRNVVDFGAFVDIGLHEDGLVHISKMADHRIKHPSEIVAVGDIVKVWVYKIDQEKQKVQLSLVPMNGRS